MSWKLAELSWRQELGLYESRWERDGRTVGVKPSGFVATSMLERRRLRSHSEVVHLQPCHLAVEADEGLGAPLLQNQRLSTDSHPSILSRSPTPQFETITSTVPLLQGFNPPPSPSAGRDNSDKKSADTCTAAKPFKGGAEVDSSSFEAVTFPNTGPGSSLDIEHADRLLLISRGQLSGKSASQPNLLTRRKSTPEASSSDLTEKLLWSTLSDSAFFDPFQSLPQRLSRDVEVVDSPTLEYLNHFLEHEGAIFEILNPPHSIADASVVTAEASFQTQFAPTESKHCSESLLLPVRMANSGVGCNGIRNRDDGVNGVNSLHDSVASRVRRIEELYEHQPQFRDEDPRAPPNSREDGPATGIPLIVNASQTQDVKANGGTSNARAQTPPNNSLGVPQDESDSVALGSARHGNGTHAHQAAGPPPDIPLPTTPLTSLLVGVAPGGSASPSGWYGRTSDVLGTATPSVLAQQPETEDDSTSASTARSARDEIYRGPSLSDIIEHPTENDFHSELSGLSANSESAIQPLLRENNSGCSNVNSTLSIGEGTQPVARDKSEASLSLYDLHIEQDQEWETTEEEEYSSQDHTVLSVEVPPVPCPLSSLPSDPSLLASQNAVSTWDPLSAKNKLHTVPEGSFVNESETNKNRKVKKASRIGSRFTESLVGSQKLPDSYFEGARKLAQRSNILDDSIAITAAIPLHDLIKRKTTRPVNMSSHSIQSANGRHTTTTEPFPELLAQRASTQCGDLGHLTEVAALYDREPRRPRKFPNARLTVDRRHRVINDPKLIAAQHKVGKLLLVAGVIFYVFGGFWLINSMANGGMQAHNAMIEGCKAMGLPVVGAVHPEEAIMAQKIESAMIWVVLGLSMAMLTVLVWALIV